MRHPKALAWEAALKAVFDRIDHRLEETYGSAYPLRSGRPPRRSTANPEHDGLFNVGAAFTAGFGSRHGRGYVVEVRMCTSAAVPADVREQIEREVVGMIREELPGAFPGRRLEVTRDGPVYKIHGDLGLGKA